MSPQQNLDLVTYRIKIEEEKIVKQSTTKQRQKIKTWTTIIINEIRMERVYCKTHPRPTDQSKGIQSINNKIIVFLGIFPFAYFIRNNIKMKTLTRTNRGLTGR